MSHVLDLRGASAAASPKSGRRAAGLPHAPTPQCRFFACGSELFAQGEANEDVFTLVEGWISLHQILEDGRRQILEFLLPGDVCGFATGAGRPAAHAAEALTDVTVIAVPRVRFAALLAADMQYAADFIARQARTISAAHDSLVDMGRRSAIEAVAHLLFRLDCRIREANGATSGATVDFPPTQEQLGDALGLSAAHVCRTLRVLREQGILTLSRHELRVHDPAALCRMVNREERGTACDEVFNREVNDVDQEHPGPRCAE